MDKNDFLGSFAQENVLFSTQIIRTAAVGDNFYKAMIFVENTRFVDVSNPAWIAVPGSTSAKALTVTASDYAEYTSGLLQSWLYDLFCSGFTGDCILVACGDISVTYTYTPVTLENGADITGLGYYHRAAGSSDEWVLATETTADTTTYEYASRDAGTVDPTSFLTGLEAAYAIMKPYAYHKTVCAGDTLNPTVALEFARLCAADKGLLSSAPLYPFTTATPETPESDPIYSVLHTANIDAFMSAHQDTTRNAALVSLGIALASYNGSGTPVGNNMEMTATGMITSSGASGLGLAKSIRDALANINVQTWKPVGDNTGNVAAFGALTLNGDTYSATWILAYITYMVKVRVAQMLTEGNFLKNAANYGRIITVMQGYIALFGDKGSGRLENINITAPAFANLPDSAADEIVVPNAWSATYVSNVRKVTITGTLYIGA